MEIRTRRVGRSRRRRLRLSVLLVGLLTVGCSLLPGPDPTPTGSATATAVLPPPTDFAPLAADAVQGLGTGANDFDNDLAVSGEMVVAAGTVYGNRLAPAFRYSTDGGASWELARLSDASTRDTPPDQGDQTGGVAVASIDGQIRWVAYGSDWRQTLTWTSSDGRTWDRHVPAVEQIPADADLLDIVAVPGGFVLVGTDARDRPTAWTSADGVTWRPTPMDGRGTLSAVTSTGSTVVAVGSGDNAYAVWVSNDRGRTWRRGTRPPKPTDDGDFSRYLTDVTATPDGFTAIGSYWAEAWRPVVYHSSTGATWQEGAVPGASKGDVYGELVVQSAGTAVASTVAYGQSAHPRLFAQHGGRWREAETPLSDGAVLAAGEWSLGPVVRGGDAWLVVATLSRNGQLVSQLWRSTDDANSFAAVKRPVAELNQPTALPMTVVRTGDQTYAFGDSRRRAVVWTRTGSAAFGPAQLVSGAASDRIAGATAGAHGVLAFGTRTAQGTDSAVVWRPDGRQWAPTKLGTFSAADSHFASSSVNQVVWWHDRWVAVGETSENGDLNSSALVATSTDAKTWTKGRGARTMAKAGGDVWYDVTDLQGDHDRTRTMSGVAAVGEGLLAVGDSEEGDADSGKGRIATIWRSDDARTWTMQRLPLGGLARSSMEQVAVRGSTVMVLGTGATAEGAPTIPVVWRSADGGRTWRQQLLDTVHADGIRLESRSDTTQLVATRSGFAVVGEQIDGTSRPVVLMSEDGGTWRSLPRPLSAVPATPGAGAVAGDALADGEDLWLLVRTTNVAGAGTRLVVQPTR